MPDPIAVDTALATPPQPQPAPKKPTGLEIAITVLGLLLFVAGLICARALRIAPEEKGDHELASDIGDTLKAFGVALSAFGAPLPLSAMLRGLAGTGGGRVLTALLLGGVLAAGSVLTGCGSTYQAERVAHVDITPGPPCHVEVTLDDDAKPVVTVDAPRACVTP